MNANEEPKIYLLPNLMTAGNLFCGFAAVLRIIEAALVIQQGGSAVMLYHQALTFVLGACLFDLLDGRLARLGGSESPFGREFDSLADVVSFGIAPALLVYQIVLRDFYRTGWLIAFVYLLCGALRLARFNCYASAKNGKAEEDFIGFPNSCRRRTDRVADPLHALAGRGFQRDRDLEVRLGGPDALSVVHDV